MPLLVFAQETSRQGYAGRSFHNGKPVAHAVPQLKRVNWQVTSVLFPHIRMDGQLVVQRAVRGQQRLNAEHLATQRFEADPNGWLQFAVPLVKL
jgi:hypothetical protein